METKTRVIFKRLTDGEIIALFPDTLDQQEMIMSYMHVGQHSMASKDLLFDLKGAIKRNTLNLEGYGSLQTELERMDYDLHVTK